MIWNICSDWYLIVSCTMIAELSRLTNVGMGPFTKGKFHQRSTFTVLCSNRCILLNRVYNMI